MLLKITQVAFDSADLSKSFKLNERSNLIGAKCDLELIAKLSLAHEEHFGVFLLLSM